MVWCDLIWFDQIQWGWIRFCDILSDFVIYGECGESQWNLARFCNIQWDMLISDETWWDMFWFGKIQWYSMKVCEICEIWWNTVTVTYGKMWWDSVRFYEIQFNIVAFGEVWRDSLRLDQIWSNSMWFVPIVWYLVRYGRI